MLHMNKGLWTIGIPVGLSLALIIKHSAVLFTLFILAHFIILCVTPSFRHRESLWMFVIVAFSSVPLNIWLLVCSINCGLFAHSVLVLNIMKCILYYITLLSVEEIIMCAVAGCIWRKQYKSVL